MPAWKRIAQERLEKKNPPTEVDSGAKGATSTRGDSVRGNTRAQTFTHDELYADAIPDVNLDEDLPEVHKVSDAEVERILSAIPIGRQYALLGKGDKPTERGDENIIRCPMPGHEDKSPSASFNSRNGAFNCMGCGAEGDILTVAAAHYGMNSDSTDLPYIKRRLAGELSGAPVEDYGNHEVLATPAVRELIEVQAKKEQDESKSEMEEMRLRLIKNDEAEPVEQGEPVADEVEVPSEEEMFQESLPEVEVEVPESTPPSTETGLDFPLDQRPPNWDDYEEMLEPGTFLADFYNTCKMDLAPNDFHFFHGLLALGLASGRDAHLKDNPNVYGNMYLCFVANSGTGKTRSRFWLERIISIAMPWDELDSKRGGVLNTPLPGSGESLIDCMVSKEIAYPNAIPGDPSTTTGRVKAFIDIDELETFTSKSNHQTSTLRPILTSMYGGGVVATQSRGRGMSAAHEPYLSLATNVPPESLRTIVHKGDTFSGFLNRFTFAYISDEKLTAKEQDFFSDEVDFDEYALADKLRKVLHWCQHRRSISYTTEAKQTLRDFYKAELGKNSPLVNPSADPMFARLELAVKKYLLLFAVNEMKEVVDVPIVEKAIRMYWISRESLASVGVKVGSSATGELEDYIIERVRAHFKKEAEPLTAGEISGKKCQVNRKVKALGLDRKDFDSAIKNLVGSGDLVEIRGDKSDKRVKPKYIPHID